MPLFYVQRHLRKVLEGNAQSASPQGEAGVGRGLGIKLGEGRVNGDCILIFN